MAAKYRNAPPLNSGALRLCLKAFFCSVDLQETKVSYCAEFQLFDSFKASQWNILGFKLIRIDKAFYLVVK